MASVYIGIPCYGGQMHVGCTKSLLNLVHVFEKYGIRYDVDFLGNSSLIPIARNRIADSFMSSDMSHLLFIDSDVEFDVNDVIKMIEADKDIIAGIYGKKNILWNKVANAVKENKSDECLKYNTSELTVTFFDYGSSNKTYDINKPLEVKAIATGMMLIKRNVFEKMQNVVPKYTFDYINYYYAYFDCKIKDNWYLSEDYAFCDCWRELGGKIYAALWTKTVHHGGIGIHTDIIKSADIFDENESFAVNFKFC